MPWPFQRRPNIVQVIGLMGPTSAGGATMNTYLYDDGSMRTVEFDWLGREIASYAGEPKEVPEGTPMPPAPPRPHGAAPLPPMMDSPLRRAASEWRTPTKSGQS